MDYTSIIAWVLMGFCFTCGTIIAIGCLLCLYELFIFRDSEKPTKIEAPDIEETSLINDEE